MRVQPLPAAKLVITVNQKLLSVWEINYRLDQAHGGQTAHFYSRSNNKSQLKNEAKKPKKT
jgi:hypothetical protein